MSPNAAAGRRADRGSPRASNAVSPGETARWARRVTVFCSIGAAIGVFSSNPALTVAGLMVIPLLFVLLWRAGEPPALLFAAAFQWSQVFVPVLRADARGELIGSDIGLPELGVAAWLGLGSIVALACGLRLGRGDRPIATLTDLKTWVRKLSPRRLLVAYLLALFLPILAARVAQVVPGLLQALLSLGQFRWVISFMTFWAAAHERRFRRISMLILATEILLGFGGYFSAFKTIIFLATIVALGSEVRHARLLRPAVLGIVSLGLLLTTYWQAIKVDYRTFLSQGTRSQAVLVSPLERASFLLDRTLELRADDMYEGFDKGIDRLGYIEFFALCIQQVPDHIPYQGGRLWKEAFVHVLTPRLLFPAKAAISDSVRTREFSGVRVAGEEEGTAISLGYAAESYIDFGPAWMFVPVFLAGVFFGWAYRWLATRSTNGLLGLAAATTLILANAILFGASNIMMLGGSLTQLIVLSLVLRAWSDKLWSLLIER